MKEKRIIWPDNTLNFSNCLIFISQKEREKKEQFDQVALKFKFSESSNFHFSKRKKKRRAISLDSAGI